MKDEKKKLFVMRNLVHLFEQSIFELKREKYYEIIAFDSSYELSKQIIEVDPDLIVLDSGDPAYPGMKMALKLKQASPTKPIPIVLLHEAEELEQLRAEHNVFNQYLLKPVDPYLLQLTIDHLLFKA